MSDWEPRRRGAAGLVLSQFHLPGGQLMAVTAAAMKGGIRARGPAPGPISGRDNSRMVEPAAADPP
jgi:hypothetical protein